MAWIDSVSHIGDDQVCVCGLFPAGSRDCRCTPWGAAACILWGRSQRGDIVGRTGQQIRDEWISDAWSVAIWAEGLRRLRDVGVVEISGVTGSSPRYVLAAETFSAFQRDADSAFGAVIALVLDSRGETSAGCAR